MNASCSRWIGLGLLLALLVLARVTRNAGKQPQKVVPLGAGHRLHVVDSRGVAC